MVFLKQAAGFCFGASLGTLAFFSQTGKTVIMGSDSDSVATKLHWRYGPKSYDVTYQV